MKKLVSKEKIRDEEKKWKPMDLRTKMATTSVGRLHFHSSTGCAKA